MSNKVIKSVSFNENNPDDAVMLKAIKRRNFSGYVKSLIMEDIKAREAAKGQNEAASEPVKEKAIRPLTNMERLEALKRKQGEPIRPAGKPFNQPKN
jgi:hypothetical protein